ncbi:MAG: hypothetical protein M3220_10805 [Chloroflexota bacterium]|nr:hypothetical protein [Chloroflexota bacterium]
MSTPKAEVVVATDASAETVQAFAQRGAPIGLLARGDGQQGPALTNTQKWV